MAEAHALYYYHQQVPWYAVETLYDLLSGRYLALGKKNEERQAYDFSYSASESDYTPAALRQVGVRRGKSHVHPSPSSGPVFL